MIPRIDYYFTATYLIEKYKIKKNKKGVFFIDDKVMQVDFIDSYIRHQEPTIRTHDVKEVIKLMDILCEKTNQTSKYYRKGSMKYGLQHR